MKPLWRVVLAGVLVAVAIVVLQNQGDESRAGQPLEIPEFEPDAGTPATSGRLRDQTAERIAVETPQSEPISQAVTNETQDLAPTEDTQIVQGTAVVGRVVDNGGAPVERANVYLERDGVQLARGVRVTDEGGRFTLSTRASGAASLWASKDSVGRSDIANLSLPLNGRLDVGDVVLLGEGEISGRVVLQDGRPVENFSVLARAQNSEAGPGFRSATVTTDDEGRFHFRGLVPGVFEIETRFSRARGPHFEGEPRFSTGETDAVIVLRAVRLVVRAEDDEGSAIGMTVLTIRDTEDGTRVSMSVSGGPRNYIVTLLSGGHSYGLQASGPGDERLEAALYLGSEESQREIVLRPPNDTELAALVVEFTDPEGSPVVEHGITLSDGTGRSTIFLRAPDDLDEGVFRELPPGRYTLVLRPGGRLPGRTDLIIGGEPIQVELTPGHVAHVALSAIRGGHIELDLSATTPIFEGQSATILCRRSGAADEELSRVSLCYQDGEYLTVSRAPEFGVVWQTERALEPGSWLLRVEAQGFQPFETHVDVKSGERTPVVVRLEPE